MANWMQLRLLHALVKCFWLCSLVAVQQLAGPVPAAGERLPIDAASRRERAEMVKRDNAHIAACLVIRDEPYDLMEWLVYHRWLGVGKVYLYDHDSAPPLLPRVMPLIQQGFVDYTYIHVNNTVSHMHKVFALSAQGKAYQDCVERSRTRHRWLLLTDIDEYLVLPHPKHQDLRDLLQAYSAYGALAVNWVVFSGRPHATRPKGGVLANYRYCYPADHELNRHVKVIVHPAKVKWVAPTPHMVKYRKKGKHYTVDELGRKVVGSFSESPSQTKIALYHYTVRSDEDNERKFRMGGGGGSHRTADFRDQVWGNATELCDRGPRLSQACCSHLFEPGHAQASN